MEVMCHIPGRLRIVSHILKDIEIANQFTTKLNTYPWVKLIKNDVRVGSLTINYDSSIDINDAENTLLKLFDMKVETEVEVEEPQLEKSKKYLTIKLPCKTCSKLIKPFKNHRKSLHFGMVGSLISTLVFGFFGGKKLHVVSGLLLTGLIIDHAFVHRKFKLQA